jgi:septum formation protein
MGEQQPFRLILASASPDRRKLLERAGYRLEVRPSHIDEPTGAGFTDPRTYVQHVAWLKAAAVAPHLDAGLGDLGDLGDDAEPTIVLTADTVGWLHGQVIGKPADAADARRILRLLSGTEHELWTGVCLWRRPGDVQVAWQEMSRVALRPMTDAELDTYLQTRTWQGCSGAYAIQETNDPYVSVVRGSLSNVIGLPMETTLKVLRWLAFSAVPIPANNG